MLRQFIVMQGILSLQQGENPLAIAEALALCLGDEIFEEALAAVRKAQKEKGNDFDFPRQYLREGFADRSDQVSPHPLLRKYLIQQLPVIYYLCRSATYTRENIVYYMRFIEERLLFAMLSRMPFRITREIVAQWGPKEQEVSADGFADAERQLGRALLFFSEQGRLYVERNDYAEIADFVEWNEQVRQKWWL